VLVSSRAHIEEARRVRKQLGGGMRQVGILAAAGLVGVEKMIDRLADDHVNAGLLAGALAECPGVRVRPARTNIVVAQLAERSASDLAAQLSGRGVLISVMDARTIRLVTHHDADGDACARAAAVLLEVLKAG
jgi:threonine aldolase